MPHILTEPEIGKVEVPIPSQDESDLDTVFCHIWPPGLDQSHTYCGMPTRFAYNHPGIDWYGTEDRCPCGNAICPICRAEDERRHNDFDFHK